jgi:type II secretory pathway pseudopilin PulG
MSGADRQRGFTYLLVLFFVAISAAALAALGQAWQNTAERERERELDFRGSEIARAIASYRRATAGLAQSPRSLDDLLEDRRGPVLRHHLRQLYADPFTGKADWVLEPDSGDPRRFVAVHSRSNHALLATVTPRKLTVRVASDWRFFASDAELGAP